MPKTFLILDQNAEEPLAEQVVQLTEATKSFNLENITIFLKSSECFQVLDDETTIIVTNLEAIDSFFYQDKGIRTSRIPVCGNIRFISLSEGLDIFLEDLQVIDLLEQLQITYKKLQQYAV